MAKKTTNSSANAATVTETVQNIQLVDKETREKLEALQNEMKEIRNALVTPDEPKPGKYDVVTIKDVTKQAKSAAPVGGTVYSGGSFFKN